jgi:hypothetical protein
MAKCCGEKRVSRLRNRLNKSILERLNSGIRGQAQVLLKINLAPKEVSDKRLQICNSCDIANKGWCMQCGCIIKAKVQLDSAKCPLNKW